MLKEELISGTYKRGHFYLKFSLVNREKKMKAIDLFCYMHCKSFSVEFFFQAKILFTIKVIISYTL